MKYLSEYQRIVRDSDSEGLRAVGGVEGMLLTLESNAIEGIKSSTVSKRKEEMILTKNDELSTEYCSKLLPLCGSIGALLDNSMWPLVLIGCVGIVVLLNSFIKRKKLKNLWEISNQLSKMTVVRDDVQLRVSGSDLVVGDVILIKIGDYLPCQGVIINSRDNNPFAIPQVGNTFLCLDTNSNQSHLEHRMSRLSNTVGLLGLMSVVFLFLFLVSVAVVSNNLDGYSFVDLFIIVFVVISAAIPEIHPLSVLVIMKFLYSYNMVDIRVVASDCCEDHTKRRVSFVED